MLSTGNFKSFFSARMSFRHCFLWCSTVSCTNSRNSLEEREMLND